MKPPHLAPFTVCGDLVLTSGQLAFDENGKITGDIGEQTLLCLSNLRTVLAQAGLGLEHVLKTTVWLTRVEDFPVFNESYASVFGATKPARSTVIAKLAIADALVEIEAIASSSRPETALPQS